jgi:hypothetical protein
MLKKQKPPEDEESLVEEAGTIAETADATEVTEETVVEDAIEDGEEEEEI